MACRRIEKIENIKLGLWHQVWDFLNFWEDAIINSCLILGDYTQKKMLNVYSTAVLSLESLYTICDNKCDGFSFDWNWNQILQIMSKVY